MTENNAAQAIQEGERNAAADQYFKARAWVMDTNDNRRIFEAGFDRAYALLSKLRAEGVQAGDERGTFEIEYAKELYARGTPPTFAAFMRNPDGSYALPIVERAWAMWQVRAALASAPVADKGCPHIDEPRSCWRVRCQLGKKCVEPVTVTSAASAPVAGEDDHDAK